MLEQSAIPFDKTRAKYLQKFINEAYTDAVAQTNFGKEVPYTDNPVVKHYHSLGGYEKIKEKDESLAYRLWDAARIVSQRPDDEYFTSLYWERFNRSNEE